MKNLLTIVIPSHNRPKRLERLLNFYIENGFENIVVADSSIKEFENVIKYNGYISYRHLPNVNLAKKIIEIKEYVNTPYVVLCAEDDYLMPGALENIVRFLELNKDYKSAKGYWLQYRPYENDNLRSLYPQVSIKNSLHQNDPKQRTISLFEHYFQFYYVVMTKELFFDSYESIIEKDKIILDNLCLLEMWQATYCSYNGKHAVLPLFYGIREFIHGSAGHRFLSYYELKKITKIWNKLNISKKKWKA